MATPKSGPGPAPVPPEPDSETQHPSINPSIRRALFPKVEVKEEYPTPETTTASNDSDVEIICEVSVVDQLKDALRAANEKADRFEALLGRLQPSLHESEDRPSNPAARESSPHSDKDGGSELKLSSSDGINGGDGASEASRDSDSTDGEDELERRKRRTSSSDGINGGDGASDASRDSNSTDGEDELERRKRRTSSSDGINGGDGASEASRDSNSTDGEDELERRKRRTSSSDGVNGGDGASDASRDSNSTDGEDERRKPATSGGYKKRNPTLAGNGSASTSPQYWKALIDHRYDGITSVEAYDKLRAYWNDGPVAGQAYFTNSQAAAIMIRGANCGPPDAFYDPTPLQAPAPSGQALEFLRTASYIIPESGDSKLDLRGRAIYDGIGNGSCSGSSFGVYLLNNKLERVKDPAEATGLRVVFASMKQKTEFHYFFKTWYKGVDYGESRLMKKMWSVEYVRNGFPPARDIFLVSFKRDDKPAPIPAVFRNSKGDICDKHPLRPSEKRRLEPRFLKSTADEVFQEEMQKLVDGGPMRTPTQWDCDRMRRAALKGGSAVSKGKRHAKPGGKDIQATLLDLVNANDDVFQGYEMFPPGANVKGAGQAVHAASRVGIAEMLRVATVEGAAKLGIAPSILSVDTTFFNRGGGNCYVTTVALRTPRFWNLHQGDLDASHQLFPVFSTCHETRQQVAWNSFALAFGRVLKNAGADKLNFHCCVMDGDMSPFESLVNLVPAFKKTIALECGRHLRGNVEDNSTKCGLAKATAREIADCVMGYETGGSNRTRFGGFCDYSSEEMGKESDMVGGRAWEWLRGKVQRRCDKGGLGDAATAKLLKYLCTKLCPRIRAHYSKDVRMEATSQDANPGRYTSNDIEQCQGSMKYAIEKDVPRLGIVGTSKAVGEWMSTTGRRLIVAMCGFSPAQCILDPTYQTDVPIASEIRQMTQPEKMRLVKTFFGPYAAGSSQSEAADENSMSSTLFPLRKSELWVESLISKRSFDVVWKEAEELLKVKKVSVMPTTDGDDGETWVILDQDGRPFVITKSRRGLLQCNASACRSAKESRICPHSLAVACQNEASCRKWVASLKEFAEAEDSRRSPSKALKRDHNSNAGRKGKKGLDLRRPKKRRLIGTREDSDDSESDEEEEEDEDQAPTKRRRGGGGGGWGGGSSGPTGGGGSSGPTGGGGGSGSTGGGGGSSSEGRRTSATLRLPSKAAPSKKNERGGGDAAAPAFQRTVIPDSAENEKSRESPTPHKKRRGKTSEPQSPGHPWSPAHRQETPGKAEWGAWDEKGCCAGRAYIPSQDDIAGITLLKAPAPDPSFPHEMSTAMFFVVQYNDRRHFERWDRANCRACKASISEQAEKGTPYNFFIVHREAMIVPKSGCSFSDYDREGIPYHAPSRLDPYRGAYWKEQFQRQMASGNFTISPRNYMDDQKASLPRRLFCPFYSCLKEGNATFSTTRLMLTDRVSSSWNESYNKHFLEQFGLVLDGWNNRTGSWDF